MKRKKVFFFCSTSSYKLDQSFKSLLGGRDPFSFWWCISAASIQSLLSPIAVCWMLHPPTTSMDRIVIWLLSLFGLSNQGEEKSSCYIHAAVPTALCPYVSPSVCTPSLDPVLLKWWQKTKNWIPTKVRRCWFVKPQCICLSQQAGRQAAPVLCPQAVFLL